VIKNSFHTIFSLSRKL